MTKEEKDLVLHDLCARLPYGVKLKIREWKTPVELTIVKHNVLSGNYIINENYRLDDIKPYLRPMSSMTEEEKEEYKRTFEPVYDVDEYGKFFKYDYGEQTIDTFDWLLANHFDFRGLIEKGHAIAVTEENNPYKD